MLIYSECSNIHAGLGPSDHGHGITAQQLTQGMRLDSLATQTTVCGCAKYNKATEEGAMYVCARCAIQSFTNHECGSELCRVGSMAM